MAKSLIPKSRAKTAYGLLSEVARVVTEEPKRFDMSLWRKVEGRTMFPPALGFPACGTVGCLGGWAEVLRPGIAAAATLGLTDDQANELFCPTGWNAVAGQTAAHARKYVAHLRRFQKKYAKQLKAKKLEAIR